MAAEGRWSRLYVCPCLEQQSHDVLPPRSSCKAQGRRTAAVPCHWRCPRQQKIAHLKGTDSIEGMGLHPLPNAHEFK